jgi:hypothetical protein
MRAFWKSGFITLAVAYLCSGAAYAQHPPLNITTFGVGDNAFPYLHAWGGVDNVQARFYTSTNTGLIHNAFFYGRTQGANQNGLSAAAYTNNSKLAIGAYLVGEADTTATGGAWGANIVGGTYSTTAVAHGLEVNGVNNSGSTTPIVDGLFIVNGGTAKTTAAIAVATSISTPAGIPDYGIVLAGPNSFYSSYSPAAVTGLYIDTVTSGEAIRIQADNRIALTNTGDTYIRYNTATNTVQIVKHNVVVGSF